MRLDHLGFVTLVFLLLGAVPVQRLLAEEEPPAEKPTKEMTEAEREAALQVRDSTGAGDRSFAAPRFWASFVCYGR